MSIIAAALLIYCVKDTIASELDHIKHLFRGTNIGQVIVETSVMLGFMTVIVYGCGIVGLMVGR